MRRYSHRELPVGWLFPAGSGNHIVTGTLSRWRLSAVAFDELAVNTCHYAKARQWHNQENIIRSQASI